jgi:phytoene dehydrogenase-like protein
MSTEPLKISRRSFIGAFGLGICAIASGVLGYRRLLQSKIYSFSGGIVGANSKIGHLLRSGITASPNQTIDIDTIIVGGGISGLSAAWWLKRNGFEDYLLLEMDSDVGGNSTSGSNAISKYPWGAHYIPLPGPEAHYVRSFFEEIGVIQRYENGLPVFNEYYLCADAHERLFFQGEWQDGLVPQHGIQNIDKKQYDEFFAFIEVLKNKKGEDQKVIFSIPIDFSSQDPDFLKLDKISMAEFMMNKGWTSKYLNWYVNYCCRDDYGMPHDQVSAWAGLHYFASRAGVSANADSQSVLTWPEGNGFLVSKFKNLIGDHIQNDSLVFSIENRGGRNKVDVLNTRDNTCTRYLAKNVIYCGARFTASKVIKDYTSDVDLDYAPWAIANISLDQKPQSSGAPLSWDNVSFYSKSLGYIVANHQDLKLNRKETVITYYLPLDEKSPKEERTAAYQKSYEDWLDIIIPDLEKMHPGISQSIINVDVWIWGHGMVSPGIDYLWNKKRKDFVKPFHSIEFAHSDMSGISIFEEAQYRGVEAAKRILKKVHS